MATFTNTPVHTTAALNASNGNEKHDDQTWDNQEEDVEHQETITQRSVLQMEKGVVEG